MKHVYSVPMGECLQGVGLFIWQAVSARRRLFLHLMQLARCDLLACEIGILM